MFDQRGGRAGESIRKRIAWLEKEASARGGDATLLHEIGRLWEEECLSPRLAALAYEKAHHADPGHLPTLRAARNLFVEAGNWRMVAKLLLAEEEATICPKARTRLQRERALLIESHLDDPKKSRRLFEKALLSNPENPALLADLERLIARQGDPQLLATISERLASAIEDPPLQARLLAAAGGIYEGRLQQPDLAAKLYRRAHVLDPDDPILSAEHQRHLERQGLHTEWIEVLSRDAKRAPARGEPEAPILYRLARLQLRLDQENAALETLLEATAIAPEDRLILAELARIYGLRESWEKLAEVLRRRVRVARDENERISLLLDLGALNEERLEKPAAAIECYRSVVALAPTNGLALAALGKLFYQENDWQGLLTTFEAEALASPDPGQRAARLFKAAQLVEEKLSLPDEAITRYQHILDTLAGYLPAREALCRLYERQGRWGDLCCLLEEELAGAEHDLAVSTLGRIAEIQERRQQDPLAAMATWRRLLELAPDHLPAIRSLARLAEQMGDWEQWILALEQEASRATDQRQVVGLLHRCAEILDDQIGDRNRAVDAYQRVLGLAPSYLPALRALGKIYRQKGLWAELAAMHQQEADTTSDPVAAAAQLFRVGELYEQKLFDEARAVTAFREVLELAPGHLPTLRQLSRIYRNRADWDAWIEILHHEVDARTDPSEQAAVLCQIAVIREERQDRQDLAAISWKDVLSLEPSHSVALSALERILLRQGAYAGLLTVYENVLSHVDTDQARITLCLKMARLLMDFTGDPTRALVLVQRVLSLSPKHLFALKLQERLHASLGSPDHQDSRVQLAAACADPRLVSALRGGDLRGDLVRAIDADPHDSLAWDRLERLLYREGDHAALSRILERRLEVEEDSAARLSLLYRLGAHRLMVFDDVPGAAAAWKDALDIVPLHLPILAAQEELLQKLGLWQALRENLLDQVEAAKDESHIAECLLRASEIAESRLGDWEAAEGDCRRLLSREPTHQAALARLDELVAGRGGPEALVQLHLRRAREAPTPTEAADAWVAAAKIQHVALGVLDEARASISTALGLAPGHVEGLERAAAIATARGSWQEAAVALQLRLDLGGEPDELAPLHLHLARLLSEKLANPMQAVAHARAAEESLPDDPEALPLLTNLHLVTGNWKGAAHGLRRCLARETEPSIRLEMELNLARVYEEGFGDLQAAAGCYERALQIRPGDARILDKLASSYERLRDLPGLVATLELQARHEEDAVRAAAIWFRAGRVRSSSLRDAAGAALAWRKALALDPGARDASLCLAEQLATDPGGWEEAVEMYRGVLASHPLHAGSWRALHRIWLREGERDRAFVAAAALEILGASELEEAAFYRGSLSALPIRPSGSIDSRLALARLGDPAPDPIWSEICRLIGAELDGIHPPVLARWQVGKADRLPSDHPLHTRFVHFLSRWQPSRSVGAVYGSPLAFALAVENHRPPSAVLGTGLSQEATPRQQNFLLGRLAWRLHSGTVFLGDDHDPQQPQGGKTVERQDRAGEVEAILSAAIHLHVPTFAGLTADPNAIRRLRKSLSRQSRKALAWPARQIAKSQKPLHVAGFIKAHRAVADRAAMVLCGDPLSAVQALALLVPSDEEKRQTVVASGPVRDLLRFAATEAHFELRSLLGMALGPGLRESQRPEFGPGPREMTAP